MSTQTQVIDDTYQTALQQLLPRDWMSLVRTLKAATDERLKHPFMMLAYDNAGARVTMPVAEQAYASTRFTVAQPRTTTNDLTFHEATFGYDVDGDLRRIGQIDHLQLDTAGNVVEAGFKTAELLREFLFHIKGRELDQAARDRIAAIQQAVFDYLRSKEEWKEALATFAASRGWPEHLADTAQLAYFDAQTAQLDQWARGQGFSNEEMWLAGWFDLAFKKTGEAVYSVRDTHVIRIPYFRNGRIETWRTRNLRSSRTSSHKYTSWPLNRSIPDLLSVEHKLYCGWLLGQARGKTLIITEGEFKCLVSNETGVLTVGIPGITEVDEEIIRALVACGAKRYIVALDRDPVGKAMMRVDGITDSQRASYQIAMRLRRAGGRSVFVGYIPDVRDGDKVGLDDMILDRGPESLFSLVRNALVPGEYARQIGLSRFFCRLIEVRQLVKKTLQHYRTSAARGGRLVSEETLERAAALSEDIEELYRSYLQERFHGARRINQPNSTLISLYQTRHGIADVERKLMLSDGGKALAPKLFEEDIVRLSFVPKNTPTDNLFLLGSVDNLPMSSKEIRDAVRHSKISRNVRQVVERGSATLGYTPEQVFADPSAELLVRVGAACVLDYWFPKDEYRIEQDLRLLVRHEDYWEEVTRVPLVVFRKSSGAAVVLAHTAIWRAERDADFAIDAVQHQLRRSMWFFRDQASTDASDRYQRVVETIWPYWHDRNRTETVERLSVLGITEEVVDRTGAVYVSKSDARELLEHFGFRRLISQAAQAGVMRREETGKVSVRFSDDCIILPVRDDEQRVCALRVLPLKPEDHLPPVLPPEPKIVRHLYGEGRYLVRRFNPEQHLYLQETVSDTGGKTILTFHELDGLALFSTGSRVVSLNSSFAVSGLVTERLAAMEAEEVIIVISGQPPSSHYDPFAFDGLPGYIKEVYDFCERVSSNVGKGNQPPRFRLMMAQDPLTRSVATHGAEACLAAIEGQAVDLTAALKAAGFNDVQHNTVRKLLQISSRLRDYLEQLALPDLLDARPIDWYARQTRRLYDAVKTYAASKHRRSMPTADEYFSNLLGLDAIRPIEELVRLRQEEGQAFVSRPTYFHGEEGNYEITEQFRKAFTAILETSGNVGLPTNCFTGPKYIPETKVRKTMVANPKSAVLELAAQVLKTTPVQDARFRTLEVGFECDVHFSLNGKDYHTSAMGRRKSQAETEAYRLLNNEMAAAGEPLEVIDTPTEGSFTEADQPETAVAAAPSTDHNAKALEQLRMDAGDTNYIGCINQYAQVAHLKAPSYNSNQKAGTGDWTSTATIKLADGTRLTSKPVTAASKQASKQMAANELIALVWAHHNQSCDEAGD